MKFHEKNVDRLGWQAWWLRCMIVLGWAAQLTTSEIVYLNGTGFGLGAPMNGFSFYAVTSHLVMFMADNSLTQYWQIRLTPNINVNTSSFSLGFASNILTMPITSASFTRTTEVNDAGLNIYLIGDPTKLTKYSSNFTNSTTIATFSGSISLIDSFFVTNSSSDIIVLLSDSAGNYSIRFYIDAAMITEVVTPILSTSNYIKFVRDGLYFYMLFDTQILVTAMNSSLTQLDVIPMPTGLPANSNFVLDVANSYLVYSYQNTIVAMNCTDINSIQ